VIVVVAPDSTVLYEAGSVASVLDVTPEELHGTKLTELIEPEDEALLLTLCRTVGHEDAEVRLRPRGAGARTCEIRATSLLEHPGWQGVVLHIWDVSDRKTLELELRLAQKLEAVGQLAAGIAHEINTPIQFVGDTNRFLDGAFADLQVVLDAYAELLDAVRQGVITPDLLRRVQDAEDAADIQYLRERIPDAFVRSSNGIQRVTNIVGAMRSFAHPPSLDTSLVDINESIRNTLIVATNEYKYVADVKTELGELPAIACNASDINQVLLNIIINAADAIAEVVGESARRGLIEVRSWSEDDSVVVTIADSGPGIAPDLADRVFDPFFTTKEVGRGTGQGLAISRSLIVERHRGSLTFESRPAGGTIFIIRLPARAERSPDVPVAA
jgi:signal transduction histidine kinase